MASRARGSLQLAASAGIGSLQEIPAPTATAQPRAGASVFSAGPGSPCSLGSVWEHLSRTRKVWDSPASDAIPRTNLGTSGQLRGTQEGSPLARDGCWSLNFW